MAVQIGAKPDSGFEDPIGMLKDCHRRIERFLQILSVVADRARGRAMTNDEKTAVQTSLSYFRQGGKRHTSDEEESLFPRLRTEVVAGSFDELDGLESDHRNANDLHETVDFLFSAWIEKSILNPKDESLLLASTEELKHLYEHHIEVEEKLIFPKAAQMLDSRALASIGEEFRARRV